MKRLIIDIDDTISHTIAGDYENAIPNNELISKMRLYKEMGFEIVLNTSRNMRTYDRNIGRINLNTIPILVNWLKRFDVPCDELYVGKPWCGEEGFYIDDKAVRPSEFVELSYNEIRDLLNLK